MFGNKNTGSKAHTGSGNTGEALEKYQKIYGEMGHMMETIGFDTQQLSWLAKKNKEAFATLVTKNLRLQNFQMNESDESRRSRELASDRLAVAVKRSTAVLPRLRQRLTRHWIR